MAGSNEKNRNLTAKTMNSSIGRNGYEPEIVLHHLTRGGIVPKFTSEFHALTVDSGDLTR